MFFEYSTEPNRLETTTTGYRGNLKTTTKTLRVDLEDTTTTYRGDITFGAKDIRAEVGTVYLVRKLLFLYTRSERGGHLVYCNSFQSQI